jgi:hypothetical protein
MAKKKRKGKKRSRQRQRIRQRQAARPRGGAESPARDGPSARGEPDAKPKRASGSVLAPTPVAPLDPEAFPAPVPIDVADDATGAREPDAAPPASSSRHTAPSEAEVAERPPAPAARKAAARKPAKARTKRVRSRYEERQPPRGAFLKGALLGCVIGIPLFAALTYALTLVGMRAVPYSLEHVFFIVAALGGLPLILSAGGVGRLAARASISPRRRPMLGGVFAAARALAVAGLGVVLIALTAVGGFPLSQREWALAAGAGVLGGVVLGSLVGAWAASGGSIASADDGPGAT